MKNNNRNFLQNEDGGVLILAVISMTTIVMITAGILNYQKSVIVKMKSQQAIDIAGLAAASIIKTNSNDEKDKQIRGDAINRYYNMNFPTEYLGSVRGDFKYDYNSENGNIIIKNSNYVRKNYFSSAKSSNLVDANTTVNLPPKKFPDYDVVMVVDESGSTADVPDWFSKSIIDTEKDAISTMLDVLFPAEQENNPNLRFALTGHSSAITHAFGLTSDKEQAQSYVKALDWYSGTYSHWGMEAGYNILTGAWLGFTPPVACPPHTPGMGCIPEQNTRMPFPATARNDGSSVSKARHLILITDGYIMAQAAPCSYGVAAHLNYPGIDPETALPGDTCPNYRLFNQICDKIKAEGITIYTINFVSNVETDVKPMQACASLPSNYYYAPDGKSLKKILTGIAKKIGNIRITK